MRNFATLIQDTLQKDNINIKAIQIKISGLVQGVGFRPFIYKLALKHNIKGWVENSNEGVNILAEGDTKQLQDFVNAISEYAPAASQINEITTHETQSSLFPDFTIVKSKNTSDEITEISPDIAVCEDCINDMQYQEHRINYPFINCTNCGPRFTIIKDLPYDREITTMDVFKMCSICKKEYTNVMDRRFHAQPVACSNCGPMYEFHNNDTVTNNLEQILTHVTSFIDNGEIIAIKGMGGFHLACDAFNDQAVKNLRSRKKREGKPFAVMFGDMQSLQEYAHVNSEEANLLCSWRKPIVLLKSKKQLAPDVSVGFPTIGAMLPYMPLHYLLFRKLKTPAIVLTSGNISDEPILIDNKIAQKELSVVTRNFLGYNRKIYNRTDDSVVMIVNNKVRAIRRSRGYVPNPVNVSLNVDGILATGAELVNTFCLGKGKQAILSQHIGDLKNIETLDFYTESLSRFQKMFRVKPELITCDMHPDYLSTKWAKDQNIQLTEIQHHHAHIASCMAENVLDEKVIGIAMDGVGYGDDGNIWGGEFMICDLAEFNRKFHFEYIPMPGGDAATKHPWRMALAYLYYYFGNDIFGFDIPFLKNINRAESQIIINALANKINSPLTSSAGRLFDAVSALTGLCSDSSFHAEAPMRLESTIMENTVDSYHFTINNGNIIFKQTFKEIIRDISDHVPVAIIAAKFHNTIIKLNFDIANMIREETGINKVVLSGGTFQNRYLLENTENLLAQHNFEVFTQSKVPSNDGGIALGQLMIAAKRRNK